jgi:hypothetical protein
MIRSQKSRVMLSVANVKQQIKLLLKLIVVLLGLRAQKALFTPANYCINDFILIRFYKNVFLREWIKTQQSRQGNMAKYNVKVHFRKAELYATLTITKTLILIEPDDVKRHGIFLPNLNLKNTTNLGQEAEYFIEVK